MEPTRDGHGGARDREDDRRRLPSCAGAHHYSRRSSCREAYRIRPKLEKAETHFITGLANATVLIHLAAVSLGLASQYVSDANSPYMETMIKALLKIPEPLRIYQLVPIGFAKSQVATPPRRQLQGIPHYESYDKAKFRSDEQMMGSSRHARCRVFMDEEAELRGMRRNKKEFWRRRKVL